MECSKQDKISGKKRRSLGHARPEASFPVPTPVSGLPSDYASFLAELKRRIAEERLRVVLAANAAMVKLYWDVGKAILERQEREGWGAKVIDRLSADLRDAFPDMRGLSPRNMKYMRAFAAAWPDRQFVQEVLAQITWYHNIALLDKLKSPKERLWYARQTIANGWSRNVLALQIERKLHERQGKATTNFPATLPPADSDMAAQVFNDPYLFDFLGTADLRREREIEQALVDHIQHFLLELGAGFAFIGRQVLLEVGDQDFYLDLLFYHLKLRCFVVIDLKAREFIPEYAGKMNFYLSAVDDLLRQPEDKPSIGIILCKSKNRIITEYALRDIKKPVGVSRFITKLVESLPKKFKGVLPSPEEIAAALSKAEWVGEER